MRNFLWFVAGFLAAALLIHASEAVEAQQAIMMFGSNAGVATAITVSSTGVVNVAAQ